jgi:hypothetical protein
MFSTIRRSFIVFALVVLFHAVTQCQAAIISIEFTGHAGGTVDTTAFDGQFEITGRYDTAEIGRPIPTNEFLLDVPLAFATIRLDSVGDGLFSDPKRIFVNQAFPGLGIGEYPNGSDLIDIRLPVESRNYDLKSPIGPLEAGVVPFANVSHTPTTLGLVTFTSIGDVTYQATIVPEPSCVVLALVGICSFAWRCMPVRRKWSRDVSS